MSAGSRTEEVRLAMAWNGGVSLAVWMGGAAVELDSARRAHLGPEVQDGQERTVYHGLCSALDRMLVIDILAGASAGGINGALLGAVITNGRQLNAGFLRDQWVKLGDFGELLQPTNVSMPPSLMRGDFFLDRIREVFRAVTGEIDANRDWIGLTNPTQAGLERRDVILDVQVTNVEGAERGFTDSWGQILYAHEYRAPLRFRQRDDYTSDALAAAARASASFPAAFEPSSLIGKAARLGGFEGVKRWAIDGGLLENAPIRPAIDLIPTQRSDRLVTRFVCYVNAAPPTRQFVPDDPDEPTLREILGYVVNLPRAGRFIDQLLAIEEALQRPTAAKEVAYGLFELDIECLCATALSLLTSYQRQRTIQSLGEIARAPGNAPDALMKVWSLAAKLTNGRTLPWIPTEVGVPTEAGQWRWGLRAAQRILLLELELIRAAIDQCATADEADALLKRRRPIDSALVRLEDAHERFVASKRIRQAVLALDEASGSEFDQRLDDLEALMVGFRCEIYDALQRATKSLHHALVEAAHDRDLPPLSSIFGPSWSGSFDAAKFHFFLRRALCIEVVRRAFASDRDLDTGQPLHFVQLTPDAPARIFTTTPLRSTGPASGEDKLTGINLGHFAAFYRASWRANDFLWGRLDAATRIVELLVSAKRARTVAARDPETESPWEQLAEILVPLGSDPESAEMRLLAKEAVDDISNSISRLPSTVIEAAPAPPNTECTPEHLRTRLAVILEADLRAPNGGFFTSVVCGRAAQYEILKEELKPLALATAADGKLGCFTPPIELDTGKGPLANARAVASSVPLPRRLGRGDPDEATSTLAIRTIGRSVLVLLATLRTAGVPLAGTFTPIRAPFLSLVGITAEKWWNRGAALLAFVAGSFYLTARTVSAEGAPPAALSAIWGRGTLVAIVAGLAVVGLVVLPLWRARRAADRKRRRGQLAWGIGFFLTSGLAALIAGSLDVGTANALTSTRGFEPPTWVAAAAIGLTASSAVVVRHLPIPGLAQRLLAKWVTRHGLTALTTMTVALLLIGYSLPELWDAYDEGWWRFVAVGLACLGIPLAAAYGFHGYLRSWYDRVRVRRGLI